MRNFSYNDNIYINIFLFLLLSVSLIFAPKKSNFSYFERVQYLPLFLPYFFLNSTLNVTLEPFKIFNS